MRIEKRTMNWLPRPSLYKEAEMARIKRRHHAQNTMVNNNYVANAFGAVHSFTTKGQVDIAIKIAHARLLANPKPTTDKLA